MRGLVFGVMVTLVACSNLAGSTTTSGLPESEPAQLIAELGAAGIDAAQVDTFSSDPLGGDGLLVCLGAQELRVYLFPSDHEAAAAAARIDPEDPSNLGSAMVAWAGRPRFWLRGPMLVLYLGEDDDTEHLLADILEEPIARASGPGRGVPGVPGQCEG